MADGIILDSISLSYRSNRVLKNLSFQAPPGAITVLYGPSGVGKTSALMLIAGLEKPSTGSIYLGETCVVGNGQWISPTKRRAGFCFQDPALWPSLNVMKHIELPMFTKEFSSNERAKRVVELLRLFNLTDFADRRPYTLSGGEQRRLSFARALANDPEYLLLDEPLSSLDAPLRDDLLQAILTLKSLNKTILYVTHSLDEAFTLADHIVILDQGFALQSGPIEEVFNTPQTEAAARLLGYRNFLSVKLENKVCYSSFGTWPCQKTEQGRYTATIHHNYVKIEPCSTGKGKVTMCRFFGHQFNIRIEHEDDTILGTSPQAISEGERVDVIFNKPPVMLTNESN